MTKEEQNQITLTRLTPGWKVITKRAQGSIEEYKKAAFDCKTEKEVLEKWRLALAAQEVLDWFLHDLTAEQLEKQPKASD